MIKGVKLFSLLPSHWRLNGYILSCVPLSFLFVVLFLSPGCDKLLNPPTDFENLAGRCKLHTCNKYDPSTEACEFSVCNSGIDKECVLDKACAFAASFGEDKCAYLDNLCKRIREEYSDKLWLTKEPSSLCNTDEACKNHSSAEDCHKALCKEDWDKKCGGWDKTCAWVRKVEQAKKTREFKHRYKRSLYKRNQNAE